MNRRGPFSVFLRFLLIILVIGAIAALSSGAAYRMGLTQGALIELPQGAEGNYAAVPHYGPGLHRGYYHHYGFGGFWFLGGLLKLILFFMLFGLLFRLVAGRRHKYMAGKGWQRHRWGEEDWEAWQAWKEQYRSDSADDEADTDTQDEESR